MNIYQMIHLKESKEYFQTKLRPLSKYEVDYLTKFMNLVQLTFDFSKKKDKKVEEYKQFLHDLTPFLKYPFASNLKKYKATVEEHEVKLKSIEHVDKGVDDFLKTHEKIMSALKNNKIDVALKLNSPERNQFLANLDTQRKGLKHHAEQRFSNPFWFQSNWLFNNKDALVDNFDKDDVKDLVKHFETNRWTDSKKSLTDIHSADRLIYAIKNLKAGNKQTSRVDKNVEDWIRFNLKDDPKYNKCLELVNNLLYSNDKKHINEILNIINSIPVLKTANDKMKREIKQVYRGIGGNSGDEDDEDRFRFTNASITEHEMKQRFVSTSTSKYVAKNFALGKGHLESSDTRRNEDAFIITYQTTPDSILFCTQIFGSVFGESEIVVDPKKAKILDIEWI